MAQFLDSEGLKTLVDNMNKKYQPWIGKDTNLYVRYLGIGELGKYAAIYETGTAKFETTTIGNNIHLYSSGDVVFNIKDTSTEGFHYWSESGNVNLKGNLVINNGTCTIWADSGTIDASNINLSGNVSIRDSNYSYVDVKAKNPNAYAFDNSLDKTNIGASGQFASAFGGNTAALGKRSMAQGTSTVAKGAYSHAEGDNSVALGVDSHAEGITTTAFGAGSHSEGEKTIAKGVRSHTEGLETIAIGDISHAEGAKTETNSLYSHVEGFASKSMSALPASSSGGGSSSQEPTDTWNDDSNLGAMSHAEGASCLTYGVSSHAEGKNNIAYSHRSHAEGISNTAGKVVDGKVSGESAHAEGGSTIASADYSHSQGYGTTASGNQSFATGYGTVAKGENSSVFGLGSKANGNNSVSFGEGSIADGRASFAGGGGLTQAIGPYAFTYGYNCHADADCAFAVGAANYAKGTYSFALGSNSSALHNFSGVLGIGLTTGRDYQVVVGKNNAAKSTPLFVVGNGASGASKSNAFEVNEDGSAKVTGNLDVEGKELRCGGALVLTANSDYLFRHVIGVVAGNIIGSFQFTSTTNIVCNTLDNLRMALRISTGSGATLKLFGSTMKYESCTLEITKSSCKVYMYDRSTDKVISEDAQTIIDAVFVA